MGGPWNFVDSFTFNLKRNPPRLHGFKNLRSFQHPEGAKDMMGFVKRFVSPTCFFVAGIFPETNMAP